MYLIDFYSYTNRLKSVHPFEKAAFALLTMVVALAVDFPVLHLLIILIMWATAVVAAAIPPRFYISLLCMPVMFLLLGLTTILITVSTQNLDYMAVLKIGRLFIGISSKGVTDASLLFLKSMASVSCLYFMILTTPFVELIALLRKIHIPDIIIELMVLIYRFIFVIGEASSSIYVSQSSRLGYSSIKRSFLTMGTLVSMSFIKAYTHSQQLYLSLLSRNYSGALNVAETEHKINYKNIAVIILLELGFIILSYKFGG